jgi:hypothetical protein
MKIPKWGKVVAALSVLLVMSFLAMPVSASPDEYPCNFYGTAAVNGVPVAAGTGISAWFEDAQVASSLTGEGTLADDQYSLVVTLDESNEGETISFKIGTIWAEETGTWQKTGFVEVNLTATIPEVVSTSPVNGATDVLVGTSVSATFNEPIDEGTIVFTLDSVSGSISYSGTTATFTPYDDLDYSTLYIASIEASDLDGDPMAAPPYTWSFTTEADNYPPEVESTQPDDGDKNVDLDAEVRATFNEDIQEGLNFDDIEIDGATGLSVSIDDDTLTIAHGDFDYDTTYEVTIPAGAVEDMVGNALASDYTWSFTTEQEPTAEEEDEEAERIRRERLLAGEESGPHISVGNLNISPTDVSPNQGVTISVTVYNSGDTGGSKTLDLLINGDLEQSIRAGAPAHGSKSYSFIVKRAMPGNYNVYIGGISGWFSVTGAEVQAVPEEEEGLSTGIIIAIIVLAIILIAGLVFAFLYSRRSA